MIISASNFNALTGALTIIDIRGADRPPIKDTGANASETYLGYGLVDFPNLHMIGGPGSPSC